MKEQLEKIIQRDVYKIINELKRVKNYNIYYGLADCLYHLNEIIVLKDLNINYPKEFEYEWLIKNKNIDNNKYQREIKKIVSDDMDFNFKLTKMYDYLIDRYCLAPGVVSFNYVPFEKSLDLAKEFYKDFDNDIYNYFLEILDSPRFILVDHYEDLEGWAISSNYLIDSYLVVSPYNNIADFSTIIHEMMHCYNHKLLKNCSFKEMDRVLLNGMREVPSFFIEHVGIDFLKKKNINLDDIKNIKSVNDSELIYTLKSFEDLLLSVEIDVNDYFYNLTYTYGRVIAYHFYNNYLKDNKKTLDELKKFMLDYKTYDKKYLLNNYGLNFNDVTNYQKLTRFIDKNLVRLK